MLRILELTPQTLPRIAALYERFSSEAAEHYCWEMPPLPLEQFADLLELKEIEGLMLLDESVAGQPAVGFMLFREEEHKAIEINLLYLDAEKVSAKVAIDALMRHCYTHWLHRPDWQVISYAMLGKQSDYILTLPWYGFRPVGQAVMRLNFSELAPMILIDSFKTLYQPLPEGLRLAPWDESQREAVAALLFGTFSKLADAHWDPRFRSLEGCQEAVSLVTSGALGEFHADSSRLLLEVDASGAETLVGFSLLNQHGLTGSNIPLISLHADKVSQGWGAYLLANQISAMMDALMEGHLPVLSISATVDTGNTPAVRLYRKLGFAEVHNYGHCFVDRERVAAHVFGQWC